MRKTDEQIEAKAKERKEVMAVRLANHLNLSKASTYQELPPKVRAYFEGLRYCDIVAPLIAADQQNGFTIRQLSIKYGLGRTTISHHLRK